MTDQNETNPEIDFGPRDCIRKEREQMGSRSLHDERTAVREAYEARLREELGAEKAKVEALEYTIRLRDAEISDLKRDLASSFGLTIRVRDREIAALKERERESMRRAWGEGYEAAQAATNPYERRVKTFSMQVSTDGCARAESSGVGE